MIVCCGIAAQAGASAYPTRPVTLVVPYTPGTGIDIIARILAQNLTARWGQGVVVDNKPGASGSIGTEFVAKAGPDGHVLLVTATSFATNAALSRTLRYDPVNSFVPVSLLANGTMSLAVSNNTPAASVRELVALAKERPGQLNYASSGNGTPQHLTMELFKLEAGIDLTHIPYKGTAGAVNDVVGGRVNAMFLPIHTALPFVRQGEMRMLAVVANERSAVVPDVPTMAEAGFPGVQVGNWYGLFAPAGTPSAIVAKLNSDVNAVLELTDVKEALARQGLAPLAGPPERLAGLVRAELARWPRVVRAAGIHSD